VVGRASWPASDDFLMSQTGNNDGSSASKIRKTTFLVLKFNIYLPVIE